MNKDIVEGKWKQVRGEAKSWRGKPTDDDLDRSASKFDILTGMLQEKYGCTCVLAPDEEKLYVRRAKEAEEKIKEKK